MRKTLQDRFGKRFVPFTLGMLLIVSMLHICSWQGWFVLAPELLLVSRYAMLTLICLYAFLKDSLTTWILVSMLIGAEIGHDFPDFAVNLKLLSKVFLRMIKTIIAPLLFGTLVVGIAGHSNLKQVGRMGWKSIVYFEIVTTIALFIGLLAINISKAGEGIDLSASTHEQLPEVAKQTTEDVILHIFPENIAKSVAEGQILQIVLFSILFGIGLAQLSEKHKRPMLEFAESLSEVMFNFTKIIMKFAPIGVGAAIAYTVGHMGLGILVNLFKLLATLYVALIFFIMVVFLPIALIIKLDIKRFIGLIAEPVSIAFATTSSEAALPKAMSAMEKYGVPRKIVSFVMPMGYSFNLDGTTLYLSLATIFVAQAAKVELSFVHQLTIVLTLMLTSKGVAGVPRASLVILLGTATSFGLPVEPIFIILGIDELMDMARTSVNVIGNCLATTVIAKWEGELQTQKLEA
ncbi:MAG: cation:dicarboxylase symporter family transporter [Saprospiraceae bacterium]|jgi:proton glutamate symport protein|nr:cation:dicarboxylase symporter family transporter [Saprospiraceae bacterium]